MLYTCYSFKFYKEQYFFFLFFLLQKHRSLARSLAALLDICSHSNSSRAMLIMLLREALLECVLICVRLVTLPREALVLRSRSNSSQTMFIMLLTERLCSTAYLSACAWSRSLERRSLALRSRFNSS